jgi:putative transposase
MTMVEELGPDVGVAPVCAAIGAPRATYYRTRRTGEKIVAAASRPRPARALSAAETRHVLAVLHDVRFADKAPPTVYAELLDEGVYLCSPRTMYRIMESEGETRERRDQLRRPRYVKPQLAATAPNQVWTWDITKLLGPAKWTYYYLYVILDIFSRYVVGWALALSENAAMAKDLIADTAAKYVADPQGLILHADRGASMTSKTVAFLLADLGVAKSHSRPHVSNDNPYSESQFKTMKYRPEFPKCFGSLQDARVFCRGFFDWYNNEHRHSGLCLLTPYDVHFGGVEDVVAARQTALDTAYAAHPERFVKGQPRHPALPDAVWINPPSNSGEP